MAVSAYAGYYNYNFGPNYIRNLGTMNIAASDPNFTGNKAIAGPEIYSQLSEQVILSTHRPVYYCQARQKSPKSEYSLLQLILTKF
jgi:hypothetical protein